MRASKKQWIACSAALLAVFGCDREVPAQQYFNIFNHQIESPPKVFQDCSSREPSHDFHASVNRDNFSFGGVDYKVRTYTVRDFMHVIGNRSADFVQVTCIYAQDAEGRWQCERARFFDVFRKPTGQYRGIGLQGMPSFLVCTIWLPRQKPEAWADKNNPEWQRTKEGVMVAGQPPWGSVYYPELFRVHVAKLSDPSKANPRAEIDYTFELFESLDAETGELAFSATRSRQKELRADLKLQPEASGQQVQSLGDIYD